MRAILFNAYYWIATVFYALSAVLLAILPGRRPVAGAIKLYTHRMMWGMRAIAGIDITVKGKERLPRGAFIIAAKHHSWGDGFVMYSSVPNLTFVTGDHLEKFPLVGGLLRKLGAIVVDNCGGPEARKALSESAAIAHREGRRILIYPEGNLARPGEHFRYRSGVYFMARDFGLPVVPVATNLGLFWRQQDFAKTPGRATVEFLDPIEAGDDKAAFLERLRDAVETRSQQLIAEATGAPFTPSVLVPTPDELRRQAEAAADVPARS
jgi:1-acyl-sn-glycerol-3-phosphate acyltransferase